MSLEIHELCSEKNDLLRVKLTLDWQMSVIKWRHDHDPNSVIKLIHDHNMHYEYSTCLGKFPLKGTGLINM